MLSVITGDDGDTTPEYQPPDLPEMDIKPNMMKSIKTDEQYVTRVPNQEFRQDTSSNNDYLPTTSSQQFYYNTTMHQQMSLGGNSYLGHGTDASRSSAYLNAPRDITADEFRDTEEDSGMDMKTGREDIGHYDNEMICQTGPIRGYPNRADGFVWRPY